MKKILLLVVFLLTTEKCPCPEIQLAKFECGDTWECAEGSCEDFIIEGDCQLATVTGTYDSLWVKAGQECEEQISPIHSIGGHDVSHVNICADYPTSIILRNFTARVVKWWEKFIFWK